MKTEPSIDIITVVDGLTQVFNFTVLREQKQVSRFDLNK